MPKKKHVKKRTANPPEPAPDRPPVDPPSAPQADAPGGSDDAKDTIYISIPMTGYDFHSVQQHAASLRAWATHMGFEPHDPTLTPDKRSCEKCCDYRSTLMADLRALRRCTHIVLAEGWEYSLGCLIEATAFISWRDFKPWRGTVFVQVADKVHEIESHDGQIERAWETFHALHASGSPNARRVPPHKPKWLSPSAIELRVPGV